MFWFSGFNGFNQINALVKNFSNDNKCIIYQDDPPLKTINECIPLRINQTSLEENFLSSWSYALVFLGSSLWIFGFSDGVENSVKKVITPKNLSILQASCKRGHVVCVTEGGGCWQYNIQSGHWRDVSTVLVTEQSEDNTPPAAVTKVCCGETVTAVLTDRGEVYCVPNRLSTPGVKVVDIACGRAHILMLTERGEVYSVGEGSRGQLGSGELEEEEVPRLVEGLAGLTVRSIACGDWHSCAVTADGDLYSWGWNMAGQLGLHDADTSSPVSVQAVPQVVDWPEDKEVKVTKVACGSRHTIVLLDDGSVWGCGWNEYGQLALPGEQIVNHMTQLPSPDHPVRDVCCGPWSSCFIT